MRTFKRLKKIVFLRPAGVGILSAKRRLLVWQSVWQERSSGSLFVRIWTTGMKKARAARGVARSGWPGSDPAVVKEAAPPMRAGVVLGRLGRGCPQSPEQVTRMCQVRAPQGFERGQVEAPL